MLRVGLTGGIGSGKSTVAQRLRDLGAVVIDADQLARQVVAPGSPGLGAIRRRFGDGVIAPDGSLDRAALGEVVFADAQARRALEAITHPLIGGLTRSLMESAAPGRIVVHDVPLLVELDLAAGYHLTVVVGADVETRMARLTDGRGVTQADALARIAAQASDGARRAAADAWLDNNGTMEGLLAQVDALWRDRITGFNENLMAGSPGSGPDHPTPVAYDDSWQPAAARLSRRIALALGDRVVAVEHIGSTSVPGLIARDVIELQAGVRGLADADDPAFVKALADKGFPPSQGAGFGSADPARYAELHVREIDGPDWRRALLLRDWLRAAADERDAYVALKTELAQSATTMAEYTGGTVSWLDKASGRAEAWARHTGWSCT
ncbi:MAG TPA: dephospho-CoA kinase [Dermatophilaceae bacterium]|nr:dephospho-CoA kinase [Dermatophilaceae bacterium]